jgi:LytS/YehU family sensor histidine kinase
MHSDVALANRVLVSVSTYLRLTLQTGDTQVLPLADELTYLRAYVDVETLRFRDRITVAWDIDDDVGDALVPHLLLQPLLENAFRYGIAVADGGQIEISALRRGECLQLDIRDRATREVHKASEQHSPDTTAGFGIGLANARARLRELYGEDWDLSVKNVRRGETLVCVQLPYREQFIPEDTHAAVLRGATPYFGSAHAKDASG